MNQRAITNELIEENNTLQNQLHEEKIKSTLQYQNTDKKTTEKRRKKTPKKANF